MKQYCYLILLIFAFSCSNTFEKKVKVAVQNQLALYPKSSLQDIYKNFFQDRHGPGHVIPDSTMAGKYLRYELDEYTDISPNPLVEPIGWEGNFCRISTDVLKTGKVPYQVYLAAFVESANTTPETPLEDWNKEWNRILSVIDKMQLHLSNYEADKTNIQAHLDTGDYVFHHSDVFENAYHPHYRIIKKSIYEEKIKPFLEK
jgi:hypothetical protein